MIARHLMSITAGAVGLFFAVFQVRSLFDFGFWEPKEGYHLFEVKSDYYAGKRSENVYVETKNTKTGEPSGIASTYADRVLLHVSARKVIYSFPPKLMMAFLKSDCPECRYLAQAGDKNSAGYLLPLSTLESLPFTKTIRYEPES